MAASDPSPSVTAHPTPQVRGLPQSVSSQVDRTRSPASLPSELTDHSTRSDRPSPSAESQPSEVTDNNAPADRPAPSAVPRHPRAHQPKPRVLSLRAQLREAKRKRDSMWTFALFSFWCILKKAANGTVPMLVFQILLLTFPLTMLTIGVLNLHQCPADAYIPIFMLGWGAVGALKVLLSLRVQYIIIRSRHNRSLGARGMVTRISLFFKDVETRELSHILSAAVLAASVGLCCMTFRTYGHWTPERGASTYCDPAFYHFAFGSTTVILCLMFLCACVVYPFTGAIVFRQLAVYDDVSDMTEFQHPRTVT